jgi:glycosyltransferase involved in cell wall biosynthesis
MEQQLTVVIPFLNEGEEVEKTVQNIRETADPKLPILLINDASNDGIDYEAVAGRHQCRYIVHPGRTGVAASRDEGVALCETPFFILLDAHMVFYEPEWDRRLVKVLQDNPRSMLCLNTRILWESRENHHVKPPVFGAVLSQTEIDILKCIWNYADPDPASNIVPIECPLGGAYASSKEYWQHLGGLRGLVYYGMDEEMIALKIKRDGGKCLLIKDMIAGHVYRNKFPYPVKNEYIHINQLLIANTLLDGEERLTALERLRIRWGM